MRETSYWKELERLETKPDVEKLKQQLSSSSSSSQAEASDPPSTSTEAQDPPKPSSSSAPPPPKKKLGLEAAISKIRGQQEQALQKQLQQQESVESELATPHPGSSGAPPLAPHQVNRAR